MGEDGTASPDQVSGVRNRGFPVILLLASIVGVVASLAAWGFLQLIYYLQVWVYTDLPDALGYGSTPDWWSIPFLTLAGLATAFAIVRLPGKGGHEPTEGLGGGLTPPVDVPGVLLAALAGIGLGVVLGPEAPLLALGSGIGFLLVRTLKKDAPEQVGQLLATSGMFAGLSFLFGSPVIAAVILIEAAAPNRQQMPLILIPGLLAAGIGSLISIGMDSWTGLDSSNISLGSLPLEEFDRPEFGDIAWTIPLAIVIAVGVFVIFVLAGKVRELAEKNRFVVLAGGRRRGRPARGRIRRDHRQELRGSHLLRAGFGHRPGQGVRIVVTFGARLPDRLQGHRLLDLARLVPGRPGLPRAVPRNRRRADGGAVAGLRGYPGRRRLHRGGGGLDPEAAPRGGRPGDDLHTAGRHRARCR